MLSGEPMVAPKKDEISEKEYRDEATRYWGIDNPQKGLIALLAKGYEISPEVDTVMKLVRRNGYKVCICSNNFKSRVEVLQREFGFLDSFDVAVFSYDVGVLKPDRTIFEELVKRSGVETEEIVYSDDGEDKIQGALELGVNAFVYEDFEQFRGMLVKLGVRLA